MGRYCIGRLTLAEMPELVRVKTLPKERLPTQLLPVFMK